MVEIAKAFRTDLSVLILDEPTASLTDREAQRLFAMIEQAKSRGVGIIYVTHRMSEIHRIGDRITVLARRQTRRDAGRRSGRRRAAPAADDRTRHHPGLSQASIIGRDDRCWKFRASPVRIMRSEACRSRSTPARSSALPALSAAASRWSAAPASAWSA